MGAISQELERVALFTAEVERAQVPAVVPREARASGLQPLTAGGGGIDFEGLNQCEASGENGWRTGRYGIEAGYPIGHLSDAEQQAWVRQIYNDYGAGAWGVNCQRFFG